MRRCVHAVILWPVRWRGLSRYLSFCGVIAFAVALLEVWCYCLGSLSTSPQPQVYGGQRGTCHVTSRHDRLNSKWQSAANGMPDPGMFVYLFFPTGGEFLFHSFSLYWNMIKTITPVSFVMFSSATINLMVINQNYAVRPSTNYLIVYYSS